MDRDLEVLFQSRGGSSAPLWNHEATAYPLVAKTVVASGVYSAKGPTVLVFKKLDHKVKPCCSRSYAGFPPVLTGLG